MPPPWRHRRNIQAILLLARRVLVFIVIPRFLRSGEFEDGERQRFAKQAAFAAHPQAGDGVFVHFRHRQRVTAGLQRDNVARFQVHKCFLLEISISEIPER